MLIGCLLSFSVFAQTKIKDGTIPSGSLAPHPSAILELESNNKGLLAPRIALNSRTDITTISNPAVGLLIYNTGAAGLNYKGYVFWNGLEWRTLEDGNLAGGTISGFQCNSTSLSPSSYKSGVPYSGILTIPYTGGNGGIYHEDTIIVNGLTAIRTANRLNNGSGSIIYEITGTPTVSSPVTTTFHISLGSTTCDAIAGGGSTIALGDQVHYQGRFLASSSNHWLSDSLPNLPILDGKIRLDGWFNNSSNGGSGSVTFNPRLVNITNNPVKIWFSALTNVDRFNGSNVVLAANGYANLDNGIYLNVGSNMMLNGTPSSAYTGSDNQQEMLTCDLSIDGKWYRIYYFPIIDNMNTVPNTDNTRVMHVSIQRLY